MRNNLLALRFVDRVVEKASRRALSAKENP